LFGNTPTSSDCKIKIRKKLKKEKKFGLIIEFGCKIKEEIETHFNKYNSFAKIINQRKSIEKTNIGFDKNTSYLFMLLLRQRIKSWWIFILIKN